MAHANGRVQFYRETQHTPTGRQFARTKRAWWDCKQQDDGSWTIHFHADFVPSEDWTCNDVELMLELAESMARWLAALDAMPVIAMSG